MLWLSCCHKLLACYFQVTRMLLCRQNFRLNFLETSLKLHFYMVPTWAFKINSRTAYLNSLKGFYLYRHIYVNKQNKDIFKTPSKNAWNKKQKFSGRSWKPSKSFIQAAFSHLPESCVVVGCAGYFQWLLMVC